MKPLKTARKAANLTQVELSQRSGVDQSTISRLERDEDHGGLNYDTAVRLALALGVEPRDLFPDPDAPVAAPSRVA